MGAAGQPGVGGLTAIRLGTQGWDYPEWTGSVYPAGTAARERLAWYARRFDTVEVGDTFFAVPAEPVVRWWRAQVPEGFVFALRVPQEVTHQRLLRDAEAVVERFVARARGLGTALGPLLLQLSPQFGPSREHRAILDAFLERLPAGYRWAVEFRHAGWLEAAVLERLRAQGVAVVLADSRWIQRALVLELASEPTADFGYVRLVGDRQRFRDFSRQQLDRDEELAGWAEALARLSARVEAVYGYVSNQFQGYGPGSVWALQRRLGALAVPRQSGEETGGSF